MFCPPPLQVAGVQRPGLPGHVGRAGDGRVPVPRVLGVPLAVHWISATAQNGVWGFFFITSCFFVRWLAPFEDPRIHSCGIRYLFCNNWSNFNDVKILVKSVDFTSIVFEVSTCKVNFFPVRDCVSDI